MRRISLHQLCLRDTTPVQLVSVARAAGFNSVSVFLHPPAPQLDIFPRVTREDTAAFIAACNGEGVGVHNVEALPFSGRTDPADYRPVLDHAAEIGATRATVLIYDQNLARAAERLAVTCDDAQARGIALSIEFMVFSALNSVEKAAEFVRMVDHPALSLLVDPLHLQRTGGTPADLPAVIDTVGCLQFCDAPLVAPEDPFAEAVEDRGIPGDGQLPLQALLDVTPSHLPIDIEVPMLRLQNAGLLPLARARKLAASLGAYGLNLG